MSSERVVDLSGPGSVEEAARACRTEGATRLDVVANSIPTFEKQSYSGFRVEFHFPGEDVVIHFYTPAKRRVTEKYWKDDFAHALNEVGQEHFQATYPRLVARYTEEVESWWFKAQGYSHLIDLQRFVQLFFEKLDAHLTPALQTQSRIA